MVLHDLRTLQDDDDDDNDGVDDAESGPVQSSPVQPSPIQPKSIQFNLLLCLSAVLSVLFLCLAAFLFFPLLLFGNGGSGLENIHSKNAQLF